MLRHEDDHLGMIRSAEVESEMDDAGYWVRVLGQFIGPNDLIFKEYSHCYVFRDVE